MKKLLLIAAVLLYVSTNAQFFQRQYGDPSSNNKLTHGFNLSAALGYGHFMVGNAFTILGDMPVLVARTDFNGAPFFTPNFVNTYLINDGSNNLLAGKTSSFEIPGATGFGIVTEISGTTNGLAYITLDPMGNVTGIVHHSVNTVGHTAELAHVVVNDLTNTDAIAVGTIINNNLIPAEEYPFAYSFDIATGAINWSFHYDHFILSSTNVKVYDCALAPGTGLLSIVGRSISPGFTIGDDAFYMAIDINAGAWIAPSVICDWAGNEDLRGVHYSTGTGLFGTCGSFNTFGQTDVLTMLVPPVPFPPVWGTVMQYNNILGNPTNVVPSDIFTRTNTMGTPEFYVAGTAANGNMLRTDAMVYKLDANLNPVGQFTYGNSFPGNGVALDGYDNTPYDGLSTFANYMPSIFSTNMDFHHIKSYYSGQSGCNEDLQVPVIQFIPPPMAIPIPTGPVPNIISVGTVLNAPSTPLPTAVPLCFNTSIPGGSNAKVAPLEEKADREAKMSPNPVPQGASALLLEVNTEVPVDVEVAIYDMLGKQYYSGMQHLSSGDNRLPINISGINMAQGTYVVKITGIDFNKNLTLLVK